MGLEALGCLHTFIRGVFVSLEFCIAISVYYYYKAVPLIICFYSRSVTVYLVLTRLTGFPGLGQSAQNLHNFKAR